MKRAIFRAVHHLISAEWQMVSIYLPMKKSTSGITKTISLKSVKMVKN